MNNIRLNQNEINKKDFSQFFPKIRNQSQQANADHPSSSNHSIYELLSRVLFNTINSNTHNIKQEPKNYELKSRNKVEVIKIQSQHFSTQVKKQLIKENRKECLVKNKENFSRNCSNREVQLKSKNDLYINSMLTNNSGHDLGLKKQKNQSLPKTIKGYENRSSSSLLNKYKKELNCPKNKIHNKGYSFVCQNKNVFNILNKHKKSNSNSLKNNNLIAQDPKLVITLKENIRKNEIGKKINLPSSVFQQISSYFKSQRSRKSHISNNFSLINCNRNPNYSHTEIGNYDSYKFAQEQRKPNLNKKVSSIKGKETNTCKDSHQNNYKSNFQISNSEKNNCISK